jgi:hypothetical protein
MFNEEYTIKIIVIMILMVIGVSYFMKNITTGSDKK